MNLIFPVAGEGSRFGGVFKPFCDIGDIKFIEYTYEPFKKWKDKISSVVFICTEEQDRIFGVEEKLKKLIYHDNVKVIKLKDTTKGPYETIAKAAPFMDSDEGCIICDCDHSLNVDPIFNAIENNTDCVIPVWDFKEEEYYNWSKVVTKDDQIKMICEKEQVLTEGFEVNGIIGCIYFKTLDYFKNGGVYVSDALSDMLTNNKNMKTVNIETAYFYGDPEMLENHVNFLRKQCSILCDIDGTLIKHLPHSNCNISESILLEGYSKLSEWRKQGHLVILTTARSEKYREELIPYLQELGIEYDKLVMGMAVGPRVLINDRKTSKPFVSQANAIEIKRNTGISDIDINSFTYNNNVEVLSILQGNSFATTYLLRHNGEAFVRKYIKKSPEIEIHYRKLKRQMEDLERIGFMWKNSTPKILSYEDNQYEFYYDMEYLDGYNSLTDIFNEPNKYNSLCVVESLLEKMDENLYSYKREIEGTDWLQDHLDFKIYPKLEKYQEDETFNWLINDEEVTINGKKYLGLREVLSKINKSTIKPRYLRPIHGDFTFENVLMDKYGDIKLIDFDGADYVDAAELDLGKMCQSFVSDYDSWKDMEDVVQSIDDTKKEIRCCGDYFKYDNYGCTILDKWSKILKEDRNNTFTKGAFYMSMYFIRFVPFRLELNRNHGIFAIVMSIIWLNTVYRRQQL